MAYEPFYAENSYKFAITNVSSNTNITGGTVVRVANYGTENSWIKFGDRTVVATDSDILIQPGAVELFSKKTNQTHIAGIAETSASTLNIQTGEGF